VALIPEWNLHTPGDKWREGRRGRE
jgi:hypothetical protein